MAERWEKALANPQLSGCLALRRVRVNRASGNMRIDFSASRLLTQRERQTVRESFAKEFPRAQVDVSFAYPGGFAFDEKGMTYLLERLFENEAGARAFLRGDNWQFADDTLSFSVSAGAGRAFLARKNVDAHWPPFCARNLAAR